MLILAFDAATTGCSVGLCRDGVVEVVRWSVDASVTQTGMLAPMVGEVMNAAGVDWGTLDRIAVTRGPGSFTGLRVGLAMARALSLASGVAALGVTTLDCAAHDARNDPTFRPEGVVLAVIDALRGRLFVQAFDAASGTWISSPQGFDSVTMREEVARWRARGQLQVCGSGAAALLALLAPATRVGSDRINPATVAAIASQCSLTGAKPTASYIRPPAITVSKRQQN